MSDTKKKDRMWPAVLLLGCVLLVAGWQLLAWYAARPWKAFRVAAETFGDFTPQLPGWKIVAIPVTDDPLEPNIIAFEASPSVSPSAVPSVGRTFPVKVLVRLAHGYNMPDCMRIKHYKVDLVADAPSDAPSPPARTAQRSRPSASLPEALPPFRIQSWNLTSPAGTQSFWLTSMLNAVTFAPIDTDVRDMAFPKIGTPDDPSWNPSGLSLRSLRRPLYNFRRFLRAKWNNSRTDLLTFLRLRQPTYMSDDVLTLVTTVVLPEGATPDSIAPLARAAHVGLVQELLQYRAATMPGE